MRARHRHFNPKDAGAKLVLDARYIAQSNNTAVGTWSDRSGNGLDATQSSSGRMPTFQTAQFGGQPVVRFDGSDDFLSNSSPLLTTSNFTTLVVIKGSGQDNKLVFGQRTGIVGNTGRTQFCCTSQTTPFQKGRLFFNNGTSYHVISTTDVFDNNPTLFCSESDGSGNSHVRIKNGAKEGTLTGQSWTPENANYTVGALDVAATAFSGDVGAIILFPQICSDSMRSRAHHSTAFSFKIACS